MSKVKSAIITTLVVIAIIVAAVFGVASFNVGDVQRYNSIAASIPLGSEYSGYVYTTIYPEGVISRSEYEVLSEEDKSSYEEYGSLYYNADEIDDIEALAESVKGDAEKLSARFGSRELSDYQVSVVDGLAIRAAVPSSYTYAAYKGNASSDRSNSLTLAANTLSALLADGEITLRTTDASITLGDDDTSSTYNPSSFADDYSNVLINGNTTYPFVDSSENAADYFSSVTSFSFGGNYVLSFNLTEYGRERIHYISNLAAYSDSQTIYVCVGTTQVLAITSTSTIDSDVMQFSMSSMSAARDAAAVLDSAVNGGDLSVEYRDLETALSSTATGGENAALFTFIAAIVVLAALCGAAVVKYKKLGGVLSLSLIILALVMLYALYILAIEVTLPVVLTCLAMLVLFSFSNLVLLSEVRAQCKTGKTMQAAVKAAYKKTFLPVLDIHVILLAAAILMAAVGVAQVAACGLLAVVGVIASCLLWWFTRFMWYVCSSSTRNKFAFGGFKREVYGDD